MSHLACGTSIEARGTSPEGETGRCKLGKAAHGMSGKMYTKEVREGRTELDELILQVVNFVLQNAICMAGEESDDMLELRQRETHVRRSIAHMRRPVDDLRPSYGHRAS
jgi:hypothetical protein